MGKYGKYTILGSKNTYAHTPDMKIKAFYFVKGASMVV